MRIRDLDVIVGSLPTGPLNRISDVPGVIVGHETIADGRYNTGVTVVIPCPDNPFVRKLPCASFVMNGYGKTAGLVQIDELGTLETPIVLTNTLSVGDCWRGLSRWMIEREPTIGRTAGTVNPVVCECNDSFLNDSRAQFVTPEMVDQALADAGDQFALGAVGAGRGMSCYQFKGGIFGTGYGCSGFAFKMSDAAFGNKKAKMHKNFNKIKVGDIIRLDDNTHSVIVMKVVGSSLVVAEGNYNASVHWGRIIKKSEVKKTGTYVMTRY